MLQGIDCTPDEIEYNNCLYDMNKDINVLRSFFLASLLARYDGSKVNRWHK